MKILFIDPGFGSDSFGTFGKSHWSSVIHHGLCGISAYLKANGYKEIGLLDVRALKNWDDFDSRIARLNADMVCITMRSCDYAMAVRIAGKIKKLYPALPIAAGGVHPTVMPDDFLPLKEFDYVISGEGEISLLQLAKKIEQRESSGRFITGEKPHLDSLPFDDRELYPYKTTLKLVSYPGVLRPPMVTVVGSRGCPYNCTFCAPHAKMMFGPKVRFRSPENVIDELKALRRAYSFNSLKFYDYSFGLDAVWLERFCGLLDANRFKIDILAQSRADLICKNEEMIKRMKAAGLKMMIIGFESGSQRVLDYLKKGVTVEQNIRAAEVLKKYGVMVVANIMLGSPHERKEDVDATVELVMTIKPNIVSAAYFTPCPGSELDAYCKTNGLSLLRSYDELVTYAPSGPRIKGIDYAYLDKAVDKIMGERFGGRIIGRMVKFVYVRTKKMLKLRHFLIFVYSTIVGSKIYRLAQNMGKR